MTNIPVDKMTVKLTFLEEALGTSSANPDIHDEFIASKAPDALSRSEEITALIEREGIEEAVERQMTVFPRDENGDPFLWDYQVKGFFKDACSMLRKVPGSRSSKCRAYKKQIDGLIFVKGRRIPFELSGPMGICQRPLRAQTPQGERVALASSETVPAGSTVTFEVVCMTPGDMEMVREWLDYGELRGLSQWRNSGKGRFVWEQVA